MVVTTPPLVWPADVDVLAIDLDVRERPYAEISPELGQLTHGSRVFLKIDSTLRGPVSSLIASALAVSGRTLAMVAPGFGEQGRTVVQGRLFVHGQPAARVSDVVGESPHRVVDSDRMEEVARTAEQHPEWLLVGSAGFARLLAPRSRTLDIRRHSNVLVVAGSPSPVTREQLEPLHGLEGVEVIATPPTETRDEGQAALTLADRAARKQPEAVVLTGGATARAVIHRVGAKHVRVQGELQPGVPIGTLEDGAWHGVTVVTKAGGFGTPTTLLDVVRALGPSSPERGL